jgi:mannose-6-phosphate isomerase-like protein (cupin superfamily)
MKPTIQRMQAGAEFITAERCHIHELWNTERDGAVSIARARVEPGVTTRWHRLRGIVERYVIVSGTGRVDLGELPARDVSAGDVVLIPALCLQRIANTGPDDLVFLAVCTPRFTPEAYDDMEAKGEPR